MADIVEAPESGMIEKGGESKEHLLADQNPIERLNSVLQGFCKSLGTVLNEAPAALAVTDGAARGDGGKKKRARGHHRSASALEMESEIDFQNFERERRALNFRLAELQAQNEILKQTVAASEKRFVDSSTAVQMDLQVAKAKSTHMQKRVSAANERHSELQAKYNAAAAELTALYRSSLYGQPKATAAVEMAQWVEMCGTKGEVKQFQGLI